MNILILGSGGREHALCYKIRQSAHCQQLYAAPGNAGTSQIAHNLDLNPMDFSVVADQIHQLKIDLVIVGPEAPLVAGLVDHLKIHAPDVRVIGPNQEAAQLEGSKAYSKAFMQDYGIPTAEYIEVTTEHLNDGIKHIRSSSGPYVLKADGLAAGKGVLIIEDADEAIYELKQMLTGKFGAASSKVVIEEFLSGIEFSVFVYISDQGYVILPEAKDYKRIGEGDTGLNTGGMGAVSPVPFVDKVMMQEVRSRIIEPTLHGLKDRGITYRGFLFLGLISVAGTPNVIEYNCRLGDPETEVVLPRITSDLVEVLIGQIDDEGLQIDPRVAATVMLVSGGYPEAYDQGKQISIESMDEEDSILFHAGTKHLSDKILTNGGRVIAVTSLADRIDKAIEKSMKRINTVNFDGKYYRRDIGFDL